VSKRFESVQALVDCSFSLLHGYSASSGRTALLGTHHGGIGAQHVEAYLNEFVFRFNRRRSSTRGLVFFRLLQNGS
jgi:hypothetical protein